MSDRITYMKDLTFNQAPMDHSKILHNNSQTAISFIGSSSTKTHKKANSLSTDFTNSGRTSFKNYKYRPKSIKNDSLFKTAKKMRSFYNSLNFFYSKKELNVKDNAKNSPLYYAAEKENMDFCEYLLENGGNPNEICSFGDTPFHVAMRSNKSEVFL